MQLDLKKFRTFVGDWQWLLIVTVAITFSGANVIGYWRCQRDVDAGRRVQSFITQQVLTHAVPQATAV